MRVPLILVSALVLVVSFSSLAEGRDTSRSPVDSKFIESPQPPANPPEIGESMYRAAAATTTILGWWQFDGPGGLPDKQGWTEHDMTVQITKYFHVDGNSGTGCNAITPINGSHSMWCGQWATTAMPWCGWATLPGYGTQLGSESGNDGDSLGDQHRIRSSGIRSRGTTSHTSSGGIR